MKKLLAIFLSLFIIITISNNTHASSNIDNAMNRFYSKLDKNYTKIENRISKLKKIQYKIELLKKNKWNKLSNKSKILINSIESNINKKINFYKIEIENQKEELGISDILGDLDEDIKKLPKIQCNKLPQTNNYYECSARAYNSGLVAYNFYLNGVLHTTIPSKNGIKQYASFQIKENSNIYVVSDVNNAPGGYGGESEKIFLKYDNNLPK